MQNPSANLIFILFLFAILYFLMWRPQQRRIRAMQALQSSLQLGDEIITSAGFLGTIRRFDGDVVTIELSPGVEARVNRRAISGRIGPERGEEQNEEQNEESNKEERPGP
jgi:preprotein translocase subunit YajC